MEVEEERDYIPIATLSPPERLPQKMGSVESHFNISLTGRDKVTRQCPDSLLRQWHNQVWKSLRGRVSESQAAGMSELRRRVQVEVAVLGSLSLIVFSTVRICGR